MGSLDTPIHNIHRIRDIEMEKVDLLASYEILQVLDAGWFGQVLLAEPKRGAPGSRRRREDSDNGGGCEIVLKAVRKGQTSREDFLREYHYNVELGKRHKGILRTLGPPFETATLLVFPLEAAPLGDLASHLSDRGVGGGERPTKAVARQLASALAYMRQRASLVHRDVRPQRVLLFASDCSRVKLSGFGEARPAGTLVRRRRGKEWPPYAPPEVVAATTTSRYQGYYDDISEAGSVYFGEEDNLSLYGDSLLTSSYDEGAPPYQANYAQDAWMLTVTLLVCLTGCLPWTRASGEDPRYARYLRWRTGTARRMSALVLGGRGGPPTRAFRMLSARAQRMFRRLLDPKPEKRPPVEEVIRYIDERWLARSAQDDGKEEEGIEDDSDLCPSLYSFHSSPEEKNRLLKTLTEFGVETTVDRSAKKDRVRQWVQLTATIPEEDEEDNEDGHSSNEAEEGSGGEDELEVGERRGGFGGPRGSIIGRNGEEPVRGAQVAHMLLSKARTPPGAEDGFESETTESASH